MEVEYDPRGNLTATVDPRGLRSRVVYHGLAAWEFHDYAGNVIAVTEDYLGRVMRRVDASGQETTYSYNASGRLTGVSTSTGTNLRYEYDGAGTVTSVRDSVGAVTTFRFGTCGRLLERTDGVGQKRRFTWGSEPDRLLEIINENGERYRIEYDPTGRISREITFSGASFRYEYDASGFRSAFLDDTGARTEYTRDAAGQLLALQPQDGERFEYAYDALGDLTRAAGPGSEIKLTRDPHGRVIREGQNGITLEFAFDIAVLSQVRFDTDRVVPDSKGNLNILDISDREKAMNAGLKGRAVGYAANSKEVLVEGHVPPDALAMVPPKEEEEKTC